MMKYSVDINYEDNPASNNGNVILTKVTVDNKVFEDILDIHEFFDSLMKEGIYDYFTCSCGTFGCGGFYTRIEHSYEYYILKNLYLPEDEFSEDNLVEQFEIRVCWKNIIDVAMQIIDSLIYYFSINGDMDLSVGVVGKSIDNQTIKKFSSIFEDVKKKRFQN